MPSTVSVDGVKFNPALSPSFSQVVVGLLANFGTFTLYTLSLRCNSKKSSNVSAVGDLLIIDEITDLLSLFSLREDNMICVITTPDLRKKIALLKSREYADVNQFYINISLPNIK